MSHTRGSDFEWELEAIGLKDKYPNFKLVPVWIVSFEGLHMEASYGFSATDVATTPNATEVPAMYNSELNVVVSADNGKIIEAFTYR